MKRIRFRHPKRSTLRDLTTNPLRPFVNTHVKDRIRRIIRTRAGDLDLKSHYDFSKGQRGVYAERYAQGTNVVVLTPEVSRAFPTSESVNTALRGLLAADGVLPRIDPDSPTTHGS